MGGDVLSRTVLAGKLELTKWMPKDYVQADLFDLGYDTSVSCKKCLKADAWCQFAAFAASYVFVEKECFGQNRWLGRFVV